jgi:hypothetical protein
MTPAQIGCLTCHRRVRRTRGNCESCYNKHREAVRCGAAAWTELEGQGLVLPAQPKGRHAWVRGIAEGGA